MKLEPEALEKALQAEAYVRDDYAREEICDILMRNGPLSTDEVERELSARRWSNSSDCTLVLLRLLELRDLGLVEICRNFNTSNQDESRMSLWRAISSEKEIC